MPSLIPGFEYDIFISYRQKDNKYDGWVNEFVENLKKELDATFKEDVSIYFDENPHDGLLETHDVDQSLSAKIKSLIFIPVISQTYCDPRSFAWQHEFLIFNKLSKEDRFGRDIKLSNGNVASRVLPVRIHDLEREDLQTLENAFGGRLRSIDLIYNTLGVNRPLRAKDDDHFVPGDRLYYRDQINKVANAVKDIIGALQDRAGPDQETTSGATGKPDRSFRQTEKMKRTWIELTRRQVWRAGLAYTIVAALVIQISQILTQSFNLPTWMPVLATWVMIAVFPVAVLLAWLFEVSPAGLVRTTSVQSKENPYAASRKKPFTGGLIISILIVLVISQYVYFHYFNDVANEGFSESAMEKSIAVLPFENRSESKKDEYLADGLTEDIINKLYKIQELRVISRDLIVHYKGQGLSFNKIAGELGVATLVTGSIQRSVSGEVVRITVQLIDGKTDKLLWSDNFQREMADVFDVQAEIAQTIASSLKIKLTELEKNRLNKRPTENLTAYDYYLKGRSYYYRYQKEDNEKAIEQFKMAIALDPQYALAWAGLGDAYSQMNSTFGREVYWNDSSIAAGKRAVRLDSNSSEAYKALASAYNNSKQYDKGFELLKKAVALNPRNAQAVGNLGTGYFLRGELPEALRWEKKAAGLNPKNAIPFMIIGWTYRLLGDLSKAELWLSKSLALKKFDQAYENLGYCYVTQERKAEVIKLVPQILELGKNDPRVLETAGIIAHFAGDTRKAKQLFQQSIDLNESVGDDPNTISPIHLGQILLEEGNKVDSEILLSNALEVFLTEVKKGSQDEAPPFNVAGIHAIRGNKQEALRWLKKAIDAQWVDYAMATHGPWFVNMRNDPAFIEMIDRVKNKMDEMDSRVEQEQPGDEK